MKKKQKQRSFPIATKKRNAAPVEKKGNPSAADLEWVGLDRARNFIVPRFNRGGRWSGGDVEISRKNTGKRF